MSLCILTSSCEPFSEFRCLLTFHVLCDSSQRDDTGKFLNILEKPKEVAAACGQDVLGPGTMRLPSAALVHTSLLLTRGGALQNSPSPCFLALCASEAFGSKRRICSTQGSVQLFHQLPDFDRLSLGCW